MGSGRANRKKQRKVEQSFHTRLSIPFDTVKTHLYKFLGRVRRLMYVGGLVTLPDSFSVGRRVGVWGFNFSIAKGLV